MVTHRAPTPRPPPAPPLQGRIRYPWHMPKARSNRAGRGRSSSVRPGPTPARREHVAVFPGSFDPVTFGHLDVIERGRHIFDRVIVAVGRNPGKDLLFSLEERVEMIEELLGPMLKRDPMLASVTVEGYSGLTIDYARRVGASVLLRGIRNLSDLQSEVQQALTNRQVGGLETAFVVAGIDFAYTSSSLIRQITAMGEVEQLKSMVPASVCARLRRLKRAGHPALRRLAEADARE